MLMNNDDNSIINALKRLERAGSENSRATEKLHEAARIVASQIITVAPLYILLPRGYWVRKMNSNIGSEYFLVKSTSVKNPPYELGDDMRGPHEWDLIDYWIDGTDSYLHGDFQCRVPGQNREGSLRFAKDIADGLLDEIADFLEKRKAESEKNTQTLESAKGKSEQP